MKLKAQEVIGMYRNMAAMRGKRFPVRVSYAVSRTLAKLEKETEVIEAERVKLCEQHARKDKDGKPVKVQREDGVEVYDIADPEALAKAIDELFQTELDVDVMKIKTSMDSLIDQLETPGYDAVTPADLEILESLMEGDAGENQ